MMKKALFQLAEVALICLFALGVAGCGKKNTHQIGITIPARNTGEYVYAQKEISPTGNKIKISSGDGLGDTAVILKPFLEVENNPDEEGEYLTPGMSIKMEAEKGAWYKLGVSVQNDTDTDKTVYVEVENADVRNASQSFEAEVLRVSENKFFVKPAEGSAELRSADEISVSLKELKDIPDVKAGDRVEIVYNGDIMESDPAQLGEVYYIRLLEKWDRIPMVMVDGKIYLDTGKESALTGHCGVMDGKIDSEVPQTEIPTQNNQSNFGTGYGWQYGMENTIEINVDGKWIVFALESEN